MSKVLKVIVVGIAVLLLTLPVYAQDAAGEQGRQEAARELDRQAGTGQGLTETKGAQESVGSQEAKATQESTGSQDAKSTLEAKAQATPEAAKEEGKRQAARELTKGLDEQVQEIKTDVLGIAAELNRLEEKLIYPSDTQIAIFVSLAPGAGKFRLDAVDIELDGKQVAHHLYTFKEIEALQKGGVQRIHVGNVRTGEHPLQVTVLGKTEGGSDFQWKDNFKVSKAIGPKLAGVVLGGSKTITMKDW